MKFTIVMDGYIIIIFKNPVVYWTELFHPNWTIIHTEYYMQKSVSHAILTQNSYINPGATGLWGDIGPGLISHMIQILTSHIHYIRVTTKLLNTYLIHNQVKSKINLATNITIPKQLVTQWSWLGTGISNEMVG